MNSLFIQCANFRNYSLLVPACVLGIILSSLTEEYLRPRYTTAFLWLQGDEEPVEGQIEIDNQGIPQYFVNRTMGAQRHIHLIALRALLNYWPAYQSTGSETDRQYFLNSADWFLYHTVERDDFVVWVYTYSLPRVPAPWVSALGQSAAIQVLIQAHQITSDPRYLLTAKRALGAFWHDIDAGGVRIVEKKAVGGMNILRPRTSIHHVL